MTTLLTTTDVAKIVAAQGPRKVFEDLLDYLLADFLRWQEFDKSARVANHSTTGVIELMPTADSDLYSFKYVNGHPGNPAAGLSTVMAFGALAQVNTGEPLLISELTLTTALRTAATSALAARRLARPGCRSMALIGAGSQSEFQALAFTHLLGVERLRIFDIDVQAMRKLVDNLGHAGIAAQRITCCASSAEALEGADIVTTVTAAKHRACVIADADVRPGTHINAVGGDCPGKTELPLALLRRARIFVEFTPQTRVEGELQQLPADAPVTELWQVINGQAPGRGHDTEITLFDSVGFALEDYSALRWLRALAHDTGLMQSIDLVPALADPRDLYRLVREAGQAERGFG